jgi:hypothetical protein
MNNVKSLIIDWLGLLLWVPGLNIAGLLVTSHSFVVSLFIVRNIWNDKVYNNHLDVNPHPVAFS